MELKMEEIQNSAFEVTVWTNQLLQNWGKQ